jgi:hypothetical protein
MKKRIILLVFVLVLVVLVLLGLFVPYVDTTNRGYNCRICGFLKPRRTISILGITVWDTWGNVERNEYTQRYDESIAEPHEHEFANGGYHRDSIYLFGGIGTGGIHSVKPYPFFQCRLTAIAITAAASLPEAVPAERKALYHAILACTDLNSWKEIDDSWKDICATETRVQAQKDPALWRDWMKRRKANP